MMLATGGAMGEMACGRGWGSQPAYKLLQFPAREDSTQTLFLRKWLVLTLIIINDLRQSRRKRHFFIPIVKNKTARG